VTKLLINTLASFNLLGKVAQNYHELVYILLLNNEKFDMNKEIKVSTVNLFDLWLPMLLVNLDDDGQTPSRWKGGTFAHWYQMLHPWKVFHYAETPTSKQFGIIFVCQLWRVNILFCFFLVLQMSVHMWTFSKCSKVHTCTLMWSLRWHFQLPFLILFS